MIVVCPTCGVPVLSDGDAVHHYMIDNGQGARHWVLHDKTRQIHTCRVDPPLYVAGAMHDDRRAQQFRHLVRALDDTGSADDVAEVVARRLAPLVDALYSNIAIVDGPDLSITHHEFLQSDIAARYQRVPLDVTTPLGLAVISGAPVVLKSIDDYKPRFVHMIEDTRRAGIGATLSYPVGERRASAAVGIAWTDLDDDAARMNLRLVECLAPSIAYALEHRN
jgi:hypothetical protein